MNCTNCGAYVPEGESFCPNCGQRQQPAPKGYCTNCGTTVSLNAAFCPKCGGRVNSYDTVICYNCGTPNPAAYNQCTQCGAPLKDTDNNNDSKISTGLIAGIIAASVICVTVAVLCVVLWPFSGRSDNNHISSSVPHEEYNQHVPTVTDRPEPTETPIVRTPVPTAPPTERPVKTPPPDYLVHRDGGFAFSCPYPYGFTEYNDGSNFTRLSLTSPHDGGTIHICATQKAGHTPDSIGDGFLRDHPATEIVYDDRTASHCSILVRNGSTYHYCYHNLTGGMVRGFEVTFDSSEYSVYMDYISYMRANFKFL